MKYKKGDWETGPTGILSKGFKDPLKKNAFYEKETNRVLDNIEKVSPFHAAQEPRYEA